MLEGPPRLGELGAGSVRARSWTEFDVPELLDHLVTAHHAYLVREVPRLVELGSKLVASEGDWLVHGQACTEILDRLDQELGPHLATEEEVLFPWCRRLHGGEPVGDWVVARLRCMYRDHVHTAALLDELRRLTGGFAVPIDASQEHRAFLVGLAGLEADTRLHIHKEENVLFPAVLALAARTGGGE